MTEKLASCDQAPAQERHPCHSSRRRRLVRCWFVNAYRDEHAEKHEPSTFRADAPAIGGEGVHLRCWLGRLHLNIASTDVVLQEATFSGAMPWP